VFHSHLSVQAGCYQNACFAVATAKAGIEDGSELFGHSIIVNPQGEIIAMAASWDDELITADCDLDMRVRAHDGVRIRKAPPAGDVWADHRTDGRGRDRRGGVNSALTDRVPGGGMSGIGAVTPAKTKLPVEDTAAGGYGGSRRGSLASRSLTTIWSSAAHKLDVEAFSGNQNGRRPPSCQGNASEGRGRHDGFRCGPSPYGLKTGQS
jgi:hypothetical protein